MKGQAVVIQEVVKRYGNFQAVSNVSFEIQAGEFVSILGSSGSGKTTLLMTIAGFETLSSGRILIGDRDITHLSPNRRDVGMVFQKYSLFPHMTVAQNIAFPLKMRRLPSAEITTRVADMLALVQLSGFERRLPSQLSGGQQQRIAVARALIFEPPVLLMDEPLGALDKKLRESMQFEIKRLQNRLGVTVIYVTHDQEEALTMSDRIAVMEGGQLVQVGTPSDLYQSPKTAFVADFVGKMNFLDGDYMGTGPEGAIIALSEGNRVVAPSGLNGSSGLISQGDRVRIAVRPERLRLAAKGQGGPFALPATVEAAIFVGSFHVFLVCLEGRGGAPVQVQLPASGATLQFQNGDAVDLVMDHEALRLFPAAEADYGR
ncbi:MAG: ABC transporter ATP-binding protein [Mesorhizobium sp.]|uniref:ABC transporter ATP-binding protein n=1 Tax=Mesorhizobium sp. TaxID=1871066 RepID=UPI00120D23AE|nr:ABC transporter ATP-binding protein [Mesorhizobium sp.]TIN32503.1 MAG: ABC transporter ATP-binding protein [Mesorhizobium sp.]TJU83708.1 MAG: ABC transporter ATP-binding protein [Mesorhizobium sp.]